MTRGLVELDRQLVGGLLQHPDRVGRGDRHHRQDQRPVVVEQAVDAHGLVHRHGEERRRDEIGEQRAGSSPCARRAPCSRLIANAAAVAISSVSAPTATAITSEFQIWMPEMVQVVVLLAEHDARSCAASDGPARACPRTRPPSARSRTGTCGRSASASTADRDADQQQLRLGADVAQRMARFIATAASS